MLNPTGNRTPAAQLTGENATTTPQGRLVLHRSATVLELPQAGSALTRHARAAPSGTCPLQTPKIDMATWLFLKIDM